MDRFKILLLIILITGSAIAADDEKQETSTYTQENEQTVESIAKSEQDALKTSSLTLLAASLMAPTFVIGCSKTISVKIYAITSGLYVANEIINWGKYEGASELEMSIYDNKEKDIQIESLNAAAQITKKAADAASSKGKYVKYAAVGFGLASVVAMIESFQWWNANGKCIAMNSNTRRNRIEILLDILFPSALADLGENKLEKMGIGVGLGGAAIMWVYREKVREFMSKDIKKNGLIRSAVFAATSLLAYNTSKKLEEVAKKLNKRADQYEGLANQLVIATESGDPKGKSQQYVPVQIITPTLATISIKEQKTMCFTGSPTDLKEDPNCTCEETDTCVTTTIQANDLVNLAAPTAVTDALGLLTTSSNMLNSGDTKGATLAGDSLLQQAAKIGKIKKSTEIQINERLEKEGKALFPFSERATLYANELENAAKKALNSMNQAQRSNLMRHTMASVEPFKKKKRTGKSKNSLIKITSPSPIASKEDKKKEKNQFNEFDFIGSGEDQTKKLEQAINSSAEYDYNESEDISGRKNTSLFVIISSRYLKTAYPLLFE